MPDPKGYGGRAAMMKYNESLQKAGMCCSRWMASIRSPRARASRSREESRR
jgi:hypothetical protein